MMAHVRIGLAGGSALAATLLWANPSLAQSAALPSASAPNAVLPESRTPGTAKAAAIGAIEPTDQPIASGAEAAETPSALAEESGSVLGDIIVTANRRAEPLQKVGIAVNAFSGDQLRALGVTNSQDITKFAPGVSSTGAQGGFLQTVSIRGVTQNDYNPHQEAPVAAYTDDVYISSVQGQSFATFDTERVEILKGPQGTLFGRNATGGLVNYISVKPSTTFNGYVDAKYGRFNRHEFQGAVGGPIGGETVAFRIAGFYSAHDPILRNPIGPDGWSEDSYAARAQLLFRPSDFFEALFTGRHGRSTISVSASVQYPALIATLDANGNQIDGRFLGRNETAQVITPTGPVGTRPVAGGDFFGYVDPDGKGRISANPLVGGPVSFTTSRGLDRNFSESTGATARFTGQVGDITVVNLMDYTHFKSRVGLGLAGGTFIFGYDSGTFGIDQISNEFRVSGDHGPFRWTGGVYYLSIDNKSFVANGFLPGGLTGDGSVPGDLVINFTQETESVSGFAQVEYDLSSKLTLLAGGRYIRDRKTFDYAAELVTAAGVVTANIFNFDPETTPNASLNQGLYSFKFGVNYRPSNDVLLYATVNRGTKAGGFNAPPQPLQISPDQYVFEPETLYAYEVGAKTSPLGRKLTINGSGFYYDYRNYQGYKNLGLANFIENSKARVYGAELEVRANPLRGLDAILGAAYTKATVFDVQLVPGTIVDRKPAFTPKFQINGLVRYEIPISIGTFAVQADVSYRSSYFLQLVNYRSLRQQGYALINARVSLAGDSKTGWEVYAAGRNLSNVIYKVSAFDTSAFFGNGSVAYSMPRTWEVGARYSF